MKNLSLSVIAILFAGSSVFAAAHAPVKKVKQATCHTCAKKNCTSKANCPKTANCVCK